MDCGAVVHRWPADRIPKVLVCRDRLLGWKISPDLGRVSRGRQEAEGKGRPIGQTLGHTFGDAPAFTYPYLWSWGGKEVEADGKTVVLNSPATVESVKFMVAFWKDAHDEGGLAWDDSNNNRAFLSGTCC